MKKQINAFYKLSFIFVLVLALFGFSTNAINAEDVNETKTITVLHTNDIHSRVLQENSGSNARVGIARLATIYKEYQEKTNGHTLLLDAGDTTHGLPFANIFRGSNIIDLMNLVGYDAMAAGNHDFNYGWERLVELNELADFPIMAANVTKEDDHIIDDYKIFEIDGVKVGVFGLTTPDTAFATHPNNVQGIKFNNPIEVSKAYVEKLNAEGADIVIALSHLGFDPTYLFNSPRLAEEVEGIDLIIDGHSHTRIPNGYQGSNNTLIVQTGEHLLSLGEVTLTLENGELVNASARLMDGNDVTVTPDPVVAERVTYFNDQVIEKGKEVVGNAGLLLDASRPGISSNNPFCSWCGVRSSETNLGNLSADAILEFVNNGGLDVDIALSNGGSVRDSIVAGNITVADVIRVFPFGNNLEVRSIEGATLKEVLEFSVRNMPNEFGGFLHIGGMTMDVDTSQPQGSRVSNIQIGSKGFDMDATYRLVTSDFVGAGGDGFTMMANTELLNTLNTFDEAFIAYLQSHKGEAISPVNDGRINVKGLDVVGVDGQNPFLVDTNSFKGMTVTEKGIILPEVMSITADPTKEQTGWTVTVPVTTTTRAQETEDLFFPLGEAIPVDIWNSRISFEAAFVTIPVDTITFNVSFNANGGQGSMDDLNVTMHSTTVLPTNTFTRAGFTFVGWSTTPTGNVEFEDGAAYTHTSENNVTLYAQWQEDAGELEVPGTPGEGGQGGGSNNVTNRPGTGSNIPDAGAQMLSVSLLISLAGGILVTRKRLSL